MQFKDLKAQYQALKPQIDSAIQSVLDSSDFILGKQVEKLEIALADYVGCKYCITCANGTDALILSLMAMGIGEGDAVFTSDFTYFASAGAASLLGATVIFVDIDERTFNISFKSLENAINRVIEEGKLFPKVIISVDLFGLPACYSQIISIAKKYNLKILEDGAQGFGGRIGNKKACSFGDISTTSFFPAKPLGCYGDGGAIFTDNDVIAERLYSLRVQGCSKENKYEQYEIGINSRLDTLQAAILLEKFKAFDNYELQSVNEVAKWYTKKLRNTVITPYIPSGYYSSWAQYTIMFKDTETRNRIQNILKKKGIPCVIYYPFPLHQQNPYKETHVSDKDYQNTLKVTKTVLSLPIHPYLKEDEVDEITKLIIENM